MLVRIKTIVVAIEHQNVRTCRTPQVAPVPDAKITSQGTPADTIGPAESKIRSTRNRNFTKCRYVYAWPSNRKSARIASAPRARRRSAVMRGRRGIVLPAVASGIPLVALFFADSRLRGRTIAVSTMISEVYDALISAGAPEDKARKAAETLANYDNRSRGSTARFSSLNPSSTGPFSSLNPNSCW